MRNNFEYLGIIEYLNKNIWVRLSPTINGVGVKAIRDIPINTRITDYDGIIQKLDMVRLTIFSKDIDAILEDLDPEISKLLRDRYFFNAEGKCRILSPNCHQFYRSYVNHSDNPNINHELVAIRPIKKMEEITFNYKEAFQGISDATKEYYKYVK